MKELRQAQAQAKVENLARSSRCEKLVEARSSGEAARGEKLVEAQARNENLAQSSAQAEAKVEKWQIWKGWDVTKFAIKKLHWFLPSDDMFGKTNVWEKK